MPREPRLDVEDALYHVIARGVERRPLFRTDQDRADFLARLARLATEESVALFAYVLMNDHFHLVLRREQTPLGQFMRRLLTGYSTVFHRRHRRVGPLFRDRYKAVLCDEEAYLRQLVRYVHLNPVRAGIVRDPARYQWSSHGAYLERRPPQWLATAPVLQSLGGRAGYRRFIAEGAGEGPRADLSGRAVEARAVGARKDKRGPRLWLGGRVLGDKRLAGRAARHSRRRAVERARARRRVKELPALAAQVAKRCGVSVAMLRGPGRTQPVSRARRCLVREAVIERGIRPVAVSRFLGISTASVTSHLRVLARESI